MRSAAQRRLVQGVQLDEDVAVPGVDLAHVRQARPGHVRVDPTGLAGPGQPRGQAPVLRPRGGGERELHGQRHRGRRAGVVAEGRAEQLLPGRRRGCGHRLGLVQQRHRQGDGVLAVHPDRAAAPAHRELEPVGARGEVDLGAVQVGAVDQADGPVLVRHPVQLDDRAPPGVADAAVVGGLADDAHQGGEGVFAVGGESMGSTVVGAAGRTGRRFEGA